MDQNINNSKLKNIDQITFDNQIYAIIIRAKFYDSGIKFFTPNHFSQQIGYMNRPKGYIISPHVHTSVPREVQFTKEVLFIKSGKLRIDFYNDNKDYLESYILNKGDTILLSLGGHGFEILEPTEMIEVKQGPYAGEKDKIRFDPISPDKIKFKNNE